jgi:predicted PurR-regulated permease PerM
MPKIRYNGGMKNSAASYPSYTLEKTVRFLLTVTTTLVMLIGLGLLVYYFYSMTALLGSVLIITYILLGPVNLMEKGINLLSTSLSQLPAYRFMIRKSPEANPRILAVLLVYAFFFITLTVGVVQFLPILRSQLGEMGQKLGVQAMDASDTAIDWADTHIGKGTFRTLFAKDISQAEKQGILKTHSISGNPITPEEKQVIQQSVIQNAINQLENMVTSAVPNFITLVGGTVSGFIYFLAGLLLTFFLLIDGHKLKQECLLLLPHQQRETGTYLLETFHQVMFAFVKGQVLLGLLTGGYMFIIYSIFHVPYAFLLGSVFALAELLPVVGTWIGITIGLGVILMSMDPLTAFWVWLCSYCYQTIKDNILAPKVVGDVMGLHPMVIILALLICAQVAGLLGVLMALPLASALNVIIRLLLKKEAQEKLLNEEGRAHA